MSPNLWPIFNRTPQVLSTKIGQYSYSTYSKTIHYQYLKSKHIDYPLKSFCCTCLTGCRERIKTEQGAMQFSFGQAEDALKCSEQKRVQRDSRLSKGSVAFQGELTVVKMLMVIYGIIKWQFLWRRTYIKKLHNFTQGHKRRPDQMERHVLFLEGKTML